VELSRPLVASGTNQKSIVAGRTYTVGFALHDDYADHRHHYVSFEHTLVLDAGAADFVAAKQ
jgi:cytochrome c-type protein NapC